MEQPTVIASPSLDPSFQRILAKIIGQFNEANGQNASAASELAAELLQRRGAFLEVWLFPYSHPIPDRQMTLGEALYARARAALDYLNELRDTPAAEVFLSERPGFFERFDRQVYKEINEGRRGLR